MPNTTLRAHLDSIIAHAVSTAVDQAMSAYKHVLMTTVDGGSSAKAATPAARATPKPTKRRKGSHRDLADIEKTIAAVLAFIERSPGLRSEQIAKGMGGDRSDVKDALGRLRAGGKVKTKGQKRAMTYSV